MDADPRYVLLPYITYKRKQLIKVINPKICSLIKMSEKNAGIKTRQPKGTNKKLKIAKTDEGNSKIK